VDLKDKNKKPQFNTKILSLRISDYIYMNFDLFEGFKIIAR
jgi:hypothetical protein